MYIPTSTGQLMLASVMQAAAAWPWAAQPPMRGQRQLLQGLHVTLMAQKRAYWEEYEHSSWCEELAGCQPTCMAVCGLVGIRLADKREGLFRQASSLQAMPHLNTSDCSKTSLVRKLATSPEMEEGSSSNRLSSCHSADMQEATIKQAGTAKGQEAAEK